MVTVLALIGKPFLQPSGQLLALPTLGLCQALRGLSSSWGWAIFSPVESVRRCVKPGSIPIAPCPAWEYGWVGRR